jgi:predicted 3-demethylubiquinone-9 3-methyltransferase (glyoxalase superfamily)
MQNIVPCLWFDHQAEEAAALYASLFDNSSLGTVRRYGKASAEVSGRPEGSVLTVEFELAGQKFVGLNGGPIFKFTPAVSFLIACDTKREVERIWKGLFEGGTALMELGEYPFSQKYGWLQDKYGLSWQVMFMGDRPVEQKITPTLMFVGKMAGKAEEAINYYTPLFPDAGVKSIMRYAKGMEPDREGTIQHASFTLNGQQFAAMDSAHEHKFGFNEATSLMILCDGQPEVDRFWQKLTAGGEEQPCGWLKDKYGLSWQVVPAMLDEMLYDPDPVKAERVMKVFLEMKKIDIQALKRALEG